MPAYRAVPARCGRDYPFLFIRSAVFRRAKRDESKRRTYEFSATIPYGSACMDPSFTMQCGRVLKENAQVLRWELFA
jgi:hypothetical protein